MIELPEAATLAAQLDRALGGRKITQAKAAGSPHGFAFYTGDPAGYGQALAGRLIYGASAFAGWVEIALEGARLFFFDGVNPRHLAPGAKVPAKHQLLLSLDDGSSLLCTVQMYGGILLYDEHVTPESPYYQVAREKPSPLTDAFDEAWFEAIVNNTKPTASAKALLATEQRIPGLGNGCLQDILFRARVHPKAKLTDLDDDALRRIYGSVKSTLADMAAQGGRDTEKNLYGKPGGYRTILSSKTFAYPCPVCENGLVRKAYLGGNVYYCPACQPL